MMCDGWGGTAIVEGHASEPAAADDMHQFFLVRSGTLPAMNRSLVNLRGVPAEEADGIREALHAAGIQFYETPPGNWMISAGAIWLQDPDQRPQARAVLDEFQRLHLERARQAAPPPGFLQQLRKRPLELIGIGVAVLFVLWLLAWPIVQLIR